MRIEEDALGKKELEENLLYGINTARALDNFGNINEYVDSVFIKSYFLVKKACTLTNKKLGYLDKKKADFIISAIDEFLNIQDYKDIVVINPLSGGAGTSLNMNINEIIANKANTLAGKSKGDYNYIHPLHHVNMHQSTNDTFPTSVKIGILFYLEELENKLIHLQDVLQKKEKEFSDIIKLGRTEMQDALPITAGMQFSAYSEAISRDRWRIFKSRERIKIVNIGGTAIGTGFNAPQKYIFRVIEILRNITNLNITRSENLVDSTQNLDPIVEVSGLLKTMAVNLLKISEDLRIQSSGPEGGIGEILLKELQEGSTIMPGKTNPVVLEFTSQIALLIIGNDSVISHASALGNFELNQFFPLISYLIFKNLSLLILAVSKLADLVIEPLNIDREKTKKNLSNSIAILTYLSQYIGYEKASEIYLLHKKTKKNITDLLIENNILTEKEIKDLLSSEKIRQLGIKK